MKHLSDAFSPPKVSSPQRSLRIQNNITDTSMAHKNKKEDSIKELRDGIDAVDKKLVILLAERFKWTKKVGKYKATNNLPAKDLAREQKVFTDRSVWAKRFGVDEDLVKKMFVLIITSVKKKHTALKNTSRK